MHYPARIHSGNCVLEQVRCSFFEDCVHGTLAWIGPSSKTSLIYMPILQGRIAWPTLITVNLKIHSIVFGTPFKIGAYLPNKGSMVFEKFDSFSRYIKLELATTSQAEGTIYISHDLMLVTSHAYWVYANLSVWIFFSFLKWTSAGLIRSQPSSSTSWYVLDVDVHKIFTMVSVFLALL